MSKQAQITLKELSVTQLIDLALSCDPSQQELKEAALLEHAERTKDAPGTVQSAGDNLAALAEKLGG